MPRRERHNQDPLSQVLNRVRQILGPSPLSCIGQKIEDVVLTLQQCILQGFVEQGDAVDTLSGSITGMLDLLPQSFGQRFWFDAGMIKALSEEWSHGGIRLSDMIVPKPSQDWGHMSLPLATYGYGATHVIDLILIPGNDRLEEVDLLTYPFLCHELGHNVLFKHNTMFPQRFVFPLEQVTNGMLRHSLADKGAVRERARDTVALVRQLWTPTSDHHNWAHEIAMDIIALWTAGPAYLATFQDVMENDALHPYKVEQNHPPYEVRANALIDASSRLGWKDYAQDLAERLAHWRKSPWREERNNRYVACASQGLVRGCVSSAISVCEALSLPRCTAETLKTVRQNLDHGEIPDFGSEVLIAAWLQWQQMDADCFNAWEREIISELAQAVMPETR
jgi:hypothetical protein